MVRVRPRSLALAWSMSLAMLACASSNQAAGSRKGSHPKQTSSKGADGGNVFGNAAASARDAAGLPDANSLPSGLAISPSDASVVVDQSAAAVTLQFEVKDKD